MTSINVHPIFVHFPIALLTVYTLLEVVRFPIIKRQAWWFYVKSVLLIAGMLGGFAALQTGDLAEEGFRGTPTMTLVRIHSTYAAATMWVYGILALLYVIEWLDRDVTNQSVRNSLTILLRIKNALFRPSILVLASIVGLVLVTITGALGGALVYGGDVDPVVSFFYHLLYRP